MRLKINPRIKSAVFDYLTSDFLAMAVLCIAFFFVIINEFAKDAAFLNESKGQNLFFILMTVVFSMGFIGIIESIRNINWKFQAVLSVNDFKYHVKRTMLFLAAVYCCLFVIYISIGISVSITLMIKHLFCIIVMFLMSIFMAFTVSNMLLKAVTLFILLAITVWISALQVPFLLILLVPVLFTFFKAKNEYREWSILW